MARDGEIAPVLPVAFASASASADVDRRSTVEAFAYTRLASTVSAGMRLMPVGQTDAHVLLGSDLNYGLVFRVSAEGQSFYAFLLAPDGSFSVDRYQDKFAALQTRAPSAAIRQMA